MELKSAACVARPPLLLAVPPMALAAALFRARSLVTPETPDASAPIRAGLTIFKTGAEPANVPLAAAFADEVGSLNW